MTIGLEYDGCEECPDPVGVGLASVRREGGDSARATHRLATDGGQAQEAPPEDEDESGDEAAEAEEETEEAEGQEEEAEEEEAEEGETEEEAEDEAETEEGEAEEEEPEEEAEGEGEEDEADEGEEEEYHVPDAEDVYEGDDASGVLHLDLDGLFLDLLGLEVNLNPVTLDLSARPGENNLLGNLLSAVTGLLDSGGVLSSLVEKPKELLGELLSKPGELLGNLFGGGGEESADAAESEGDEEPTDGVLSRAFGWIREKLAAVGSWIRERLAGLVPSLPVEEIVATVVREVIQQVIEQMEPQEDDEEAGGGTESESPSQAEAQ